MSEKYEIKIETNGNNLPLNPFIQEFYSNIILASLKSLKGVPEQIDSVSITVKKN